MPLIPVRKTMERFHICPVFARMNGCFVHLKKFRVDKLALRMSSHLLDDSVLYLSLCMDARYASPSG